jgi:hypothetical protein
MGSRSAALRAGMYPKKMPIKAEEPKATAMEAGVLEVDQLARRAIVSILSS